jgi:lipoprotein-releasing system permease protein
MTSLTAWLLPVVELLGVIVIAILLVSLLVTGLLRALRRLSDARATPSWRLLLALRVLVGFRDERPGRLRKWIPVSGQNFIAMVGTAIGVWALIVVLSVMGGFEADLKGKIVRHTPTVAVEPATVAEDEDPAARVKALAADLKAAVPGAEVSEAYVEADAMITSPTNMSPGMTVRGLAAGGALEGAWLRPSASGKALRGLSDPVRLIPDREMGFARRRKVERPGEAAAGVAAVMAGTGSGSGPGTEAGAGGDAGEDMPAITSDTGSRGRVLPGVLLGEELARSLAVGTGDEVIVVVPDGDVGPTGVRPRTRTFRVAGTFVSGLYEHDLKTAYVDEAEAEALFLLGAPNRVAVMRGDVDRLDAVEAAARASVDRHGGGEVRTVAQANRSLFSALMVEKIAMFLVLGLVILVAAFNVFGSLVLITMEKARDVAVLRGLGATRGSVRDVFLALGSVIGAVGTGAGLVLGLATCAYIRFAGIRLPAEYYLRTLPVEVRAYEVALVAAAALGSALLATLYPATSVARPSPADGLRND